MTDLPALGNFKPTGFGHECLRKSVGCYGKRILESVTTMRYSLATS